MSDTIPIHCPKCGNEVIEATAQLDADNKLESAACPSCGYTITRDEVIEQMRQFAFKKIRSSLRGR